MGSSLRGAAEQGVSAKQEFSPSRSRGSANSDSWRRCAGQLCHTVDPFVGSVGTRTAARAWNRSRCPRPHLGSQGPLWLTSTSLTRRGPCGFLAPDPLHASPGLIDPQLVERPRVSTPQHHPSGSTPHRRFILPTTTNKREIPDILCVLIVLTDMGVPEEGVSASPGVVPHAAP